MGRGWGAKSRIEVADQGQSRALRVDDKMPSELGFYQVRPVEAATGIEPVYRALQSRNDGEKHPD